MQSSSTRRLPALAAAALLSLGLAVPVTAAGPVSVTVNGQPANLNPPPSERAGRVFVPLRGVFEKLGASVVYANGAINATGRGHSVSLRIGSTQATVDGRQQNLDVAPFIIGASTYVPLRFVSQALGATVNYDGANRVVAITTNGGGGAPPPPPSQTITPAPRTGPHGAITLATVIPGRGASVSSRRPTIEATFGGGTVDPNTLKITLDGADVTADATRSPSGFTYLPRSPLQAGQHVVRVTGTDSNGQTFERGWTFTSGTSAATAGTITNLTPPNGATVPARFTVSGHTSPGARVTIQVGVTSNPSTVGQIIGAIIGGGGAQQNSASYTVNADANGNFSAGVNLAGAPSGTRVGLAVVATDPNTGASGTPVQETLTIQ